MLRHAFKEWAAVCGALAAGTQAVILRKGGVAETTPDGLFRPEHTRFWLYPTFAHQQHGGVKTSAAALLADAEANRPPAGTVRLTHFVEVAGVYEVRSPAAALLLDELHVWTEETVRNRFHYRTQGLYVLTARVYRAAVPAEVPELAEYAGCKTWVELDRDLPTDGAGPVLDDAAFGRVVERVSARLHPTATV